MLLILYANPLRSPRLIPSRHGRRAGITVAAHDDKCAFCTVSAMIADVNSPLLENSAVARVRPENFPAGRQPIIRSWWH